MNVEDNNNQQNQTQPAANKSTQSLNGGQIPSHTSNSQLLTTKHQTPVTVPPATKQSNNSPSGSNSNQPKDQKHKLTEEITPETFSGSGSAFGPPKSPVPPTSQSAATQTSKANNTNNKKDTKKFKKSKNKKSNLIKYLIAAILILILAGGVYYLVQKREEPVPTAPVSEPEAEKVGDCTLEFDVPSPTPSPEPTYLSCGETGCETDADCAGDLICLEVGTSATICSEPKTESYDFPTMCESGFDPNDQEATYNACCTQPMCVEDMVISYKELPGTTQAEDELEFSAIGPSNYTDIILQLEYKTKTGTTISADFEKINLPPSSTQVTDAGNKQWLWEPIKLSITDLIQAKIFVNVSNEEQPEETGELCGTLSPDISPTPSATPTPTPEPGECGSENCTTDEDCAENLICITADDGNNYCAEEAYQDACIADPSFDTCCTAPTNTPTATPTEEPTNTPEPDSTSTPTNTPQPTGIQTVDTSVDCNDPCATNADCDNISHICYNGRCRLDINPEDEYCRTPQGETTVERIITPPVSGPQDWLNFLKIGIGAIGAGLLMLLLI
jgi:hypothetical protein